VDITPIDFVFTRPEGKVTEVTFVKQHVGRPKMMVEHMTFIDFVFTMSKVNGRVTCKKCKNVF